MWKFKLIIYFASLLFVLQRCECKRARGVRKSVIDKYYEDSDDDLENANEEAQQLSAILDRSTKTHNDVVAMYNQIEPIFGNSGVGVAQQRGKIFEFLTNLKNKLVAKIEAVLKKIELYEDMVYKMKDKIKQLLHSPTLHTDNTAKKLLSFLEDKTKEYTEKIEDLKTESKDLKQEYKEIESTS